jgi:hypothetical protein
MTTTAQLDALIDELTVDAYGDEEQLRAFLTGAEEALRRGEPARIVGVDAPSSARWGVGRESVDIFGKIPANRRIHRGLLHGRPLVAGQESRSAGPEPQLA